MVAASALPPPPLYSVYSLRVFSAAYLSPIALPCTLPPLSHGTLSPSTDFPFSRGDMQGPAHCPCLPVHLYFISRPTTTTDSLPTRTASTPATLLQVSEHALLFLAYVPGMPPAFQMLARLSLCHFLQEAVTRLDLHPDLFPCPSFHLHPVSVMCKHNSRNRLTRQRSKSLPLWHIRFTINKILKHVMC